MKQSIELKSAGLTLRRTDRRDVPGLPEQGRPDGAAAANDTDLPAADFFPDSLFIFLHIRSEHALFPACYAICYESVYIQHLHIFLIYKFSQFFCTFVPNLG